MTNTLVWCLVWRTMLASTKRCTNKSNCCYAISKSCIMHIKRNTQTTKSKFCSLRRKWCFTVSSSGTLLSVSVPFIKTPSWWLMHWSIKKKNKEEQNKEKQNKEKQNKDNKQDTMEDINEKVNKFDAVKKFCETKVSGFYPLWKMTWYQFEHFWGNATSWVVQCQIQGTIITSSQFQQLK